MTAIATAAVCPSGPPSAGSSRWAIVGSPSAPMPIEAIVIPIWHAAM